MNFLKDGLSLNEFKFSSLVIAFICIVGVAIFGYITGGDITNNWLDLAKTLIYVIGGVNAVKGVSEIMDSVERSKRKTISKQEDNKTDDNYNEYEGRL